MNEKIDGLLKSADPANKLNLTEPGAFTPKAKRAARSGEWLGLQGRKQRFATMAGAFVVVIGLATALVGMAPHGTTPMLTLGSASSATSAQADSAAGKMAGGLMMPWFQFSYEAASNFQGSEPTKTMYRLKLAGDPKLILSALGKQVGIAGQVQTFDEASYGPNNFYIGSSDSTKPTVTINWAGTGSWSYSDPTAYPQCQPVSTDESGTSACDAPDGSTSKSNFPTNAVAAALAARIFTAGGLKVTASDIKITKDDYSMWAAASLEVAGQPTALTWQASWSPTGQLAYAYGQSITVEKVSDVPTVDAKNAISRLGDWRWSGQVADSFYPTGPMAYGRMATDAIGTEGGAGSSTGGSTDASTGSAVAPTEPTSPPDQIVDPTEEPIPTPEVKVFLIAKATSALLLIYDSEGNAWLAPGYFFEGEEGVAGAVLAVADGVIKLPATDVVMPMVK